MHPSHCRVCNQRWCGVGDHGAVQVIHLSCQMTLAPVFTLGSWDAEKDRDKF
jgi:hypothetical protein